MNYLKSLLIGSALALPQLGFGQPVGSGGHYPIGVEGIKAGTLPPPGLYLRDYNYFYGAGQVNDAQGNRVGVPFEMFAYANAIRPIWITKLKLLGGNYGMDVLIPFFYETVKVNGVRQDTGGLGDLYVEPITLSWHYQKADLGVGYGLWIPTGVHNVGELSPGLGYYSHMVTAGGTYYFDPEKTWSLSALARYEIHTKNSDYDLYPGDTLSLEWGLGKKLNQAVELGVIGYWQQETTKDQGKNANPHLYSRVGVGPEVTLYCPKCALFVSVRYAYEVSADEWTQGHTGEITITKRF